MNWVSYSKGPLPRGQMNRAFWNPSNHSGKDVSVNKLLTWTLRNRALSNS
jgi:hypothetical protein